ncbi:MAG: ankyrin repeat domain-containing protein [Sulfitobacter sp.]
MTNTLPAHANIEWLKKTAKQQKNRLSRANPTVKLADVQFDLAKEYGFSSWRALTAFCAQQDPQPSAQNNQVDGFLRHVSEGQHDAILAALALNPEFANATGNHPYWGGHPHPLHLAVEGNRHAILKLLLAHGSDPNGANTHYDHWSPLMLALFNARDDMVTTLRAQGAQMGLCEALLAGDDDLVRNHLEGLQDTNFPRPSGSLVALARTPKAIHQLLRHGFTTHEVDRWGSNAMDALSRLGAKGQALVDTLAQNGIHLDAKDVARLGDLERLQQMLGSGQSNTIPDEVLMAAVDFGHIKMVRWLLENGANINARHAIGSKGTALHSAAWNGDLAMLKCLLEHGAPTDALDKEHKTTPLVWAQTARTVTNNEKCSDVAEFLSNLKT